MWLEWPDGGVGGIEHEVIHEREVRCGGGCMGVISLLPHGPLKVSVEEAHDLTSFVRISGLQKGKDDAGRWVRRLLHKSR